MPRPTDCPSESTLRLLGSDHLGDATFAAVEAHVESCDRCRETMERIVRSELNDDAPAPNGDDPEIPGFVIERELGRGGAGIVYLATEPGLERQVALKLVARVRPEDPKQRARWMAEARAASRLRHENIVRLYRVDETDDWLVLVFEHIPGGTLKNRLGAPVDPTDAARLTETVARAVAHIHEKGLLHLDLKPSNILLDGPADVGLGEAVPKVSDFGIARFSTDSGLTWRGRTGPWGTPTYMSPEQAESKSAAIGPAADLYALGAVLYEMLTGRPPFRSDSVPETLDRIRREPPAPPRSLAPGVPRDLQAICLRCLEKDPAERYPSASELADDLAAWLAGRPVAARRKPARRRRLFAAGLLSVLFGLAAWGVAARRADAIPDRATWISLLETNDVPKNAKGFETFRRAVIRHSRDLAADPDIDIDDLAAIAVLERQHAQRYLYAAEGRDVLDTLLAMSIELLTECLRREGNNQNLLYELVLSEIAVGDFPDAEVAVDSGRLVHLERAEKLARRLESPNHRLIALRHISDTRRLYAGRFRQLGRTAQARALYESDLRTHAETGPPDSETTGLVWRVRLSREGIGLAKPLFTSRELLSAEGDRWFGPEDREFLIHESLVATFADGVFRDRPLGDRPAEEADREARELLDAAIRGCAEGGIDDRMIPKATRQLLRSYVGGTSQKFRTGGRLDRAVDVARRYLACCERIVAAYPDDPDGFLALSEAHIQTAKNAWRASDDDGARAALLLARDAARHAAGIAPDSYYARDVVEDRERRLARALGEAAGARSKP